MPYPKIRLQNHGKKNHKLWWIVIQSSNKCFKGRFIEKVGYWIPNRRKTVDRAIIYNKHRLNYWLAIGAQPTEGVHRLLSMLNVLPKKPIPFGSNSLYPKPEKTYKLEFFHKHRWGIEPNQIDSVNTFYQQKIEEMKQIYERKNLIDMEALNEMTGQSRFLKKDPDEKTGTDMDTDNIDSDDHDFYSRKRNFEIITKKFNKHLESKYQLYRGNDLQYNNYVRKMEKLASGMSLDVSGFKDFLTNINKMKDSQMELAKKLSANFFKEYQEREIRREENKKFDENKQATAFTNSCLNEMKVILDSLERGINEEFKRFYKVCDEDLQRNEFQEIRNLRITKFIKKMRMSLISLSIMQYLGANENTKSTYDELYSKIDKEIDFSDIPYAQQDLFNVVLHNRTSEFHDQLFSSISKYIASTDTIKKYRNVLIDNETLRALNQDQYKGTIAGNESYLLYNDIVLENAIYHANNVISKTYNINDIYRDQEKIEEMEKKDKERLKKKENLREKIKNLRERLFNDLIFDENVEDMKVKVITDKSSQILPINIEDKGNIYIDIPAMSSDVKKFRLRRKIDKKLKFTNKSELPIALQLAEKEIDKEENLDEPLEKKFKIFNEIDLVHPDKKPMNRKLTEIEIEEDKRKFEYLENEKLNREKYSNYDPSEKLHEYFNKSFEESKGLFTDEREKEELNKYLKYGPPVREFYDNMADYYEEMEKAKLEANNMKKRMESYQILTFNENLEMLEKEKSIIQQLYIEEQKMDVIDQKSFLKDIEDNMNRITVLTPIYYEIEKFEVEERLNRLSSLDINSPEFKKSIKDAISVFESKKPQLKQLEETLNFGKYEEYINKYQYDPINGKIEAEFQRLEHVHRYENPELHLEKMKVVEDKPYPKQLNRRDKRKKSYLINYKKVMSIPPPRRNKDDPVREKEKRKPRNIEKENIRLMSNVVRQNFKNTQLTEERSKLVKERYTQYFGHFRPLMYPDGFRHLENYNTFKFVFPDKNMNDYQNELYSICDFDTFFQVVLGHFEQFKKFGLLAFEFEELFHLLPFYVSYLKSKHSMFIPVIKESYRTILREYQANDRNFTVLDAVELVCQFNQNILSIPKIKDIFDPANDSMNLYLDQSYIPTKYTSIPFPNIKSDLGEDSGLIRTSPFFPINPLKGHPIRQNAKKNERIVNNYKMNFNQKGKRFHYNARKVYNENEDDQVNKTQEELDLKSETLHNMKIRYLTWRFHNSDLKI